MAIWAENASPATQPYPGAGDPPAKLLPASSRPTKMEMLRLDRRKQPQLQRTHECMLVKRNKRRAFPATAIERRSIELRSLGLSRG